MRRRGKVLIPSTPSTALGNQQCLIGLDHLAEDLARVGVADFGAGRDGEVDVLRRLAAHVLALTMLAAFCSPVCVIPIVQKRSEIAVDFEIDAAPHAPIAAVRAALRNEFFATERGGSGAACAGGHLNHNAIYEHRCLTDPGRKPGEKRIQPRGLWVPGLAPGVRTSLRIERPLPDIRPHFPELEGAFLG